MHLEFRNINDAYRTLTTQLSKALASGSTHQWSQRMTRNGFVWKMRKPVMVTYEKPMERVLFHTERDANPFFHLFEAVWMLAGKNDVAFLKQYNSRIDKYSDDGEVFWGAYGYRWRRWFLTDQINWVIQHLKNEPESRRAVVSMWDTRTDQKKVDAQGKDVPCNTHIYFELDRDSELDRYKLNMTVCNRSNDILWGAFGANVVHMSILQEYIARWLDADVGWYTQMSNNFHFYEATWHDDLAVVEGDPYAHGVVQHLPLMSDPSRLITEMRLWCDHNDSSKLKEPFMANLVLPMDAAWKHHKAREYDKALEQMEAVVPSDWRMAGIMWLKKRRDRWMRVNATTT